jgi:PIN domain nuclease of toxin-antitoxin system
VRLLVDTHAFLWMALEPERLSDTARDLLVDPSVEKRLSIVSAWEMAIKLSLGKLQLDDPLDELIESEAIDNGFVWQSLRRAHVVAVATLPFHHRDPFDRVLVAQAAHEGLVLLSADVAFDAYEVRRAW